VKSRCSRAQLKCLDSTPVCHCDHLAESRSSRNSGMVGESVVALNIGDRPVNHRERDSRELSTWSHELMRGAGYDGSLAGRLRRTSGI
jgi:hypothetical protein